VLLPGDDQVGVVAVFAPTNGASEVAQSPAVIGRGLTEASNVVQYCAEFTLNGFACQVSVRPDAHFSSFPAVPSSPVASEELKQRGASSLREVLVGIAMTHVVHFSCQKVVDEDV
jgi:hypothetical protein